MLETVDVGSVAGWHSWLEKNHTAKRGVWLVFHRPDSGVSSIAYGEALDEALAYGWIDSVIMRIDESKYARKFTPRRPYSIWSSLNIARVARLSKEGKMTRWGLDAFAKRTDEVSVLERINAEGVKIPLDLKNALRKNRKAWTNFERMAPSHRKRYLIWITGAKRPETRQRRISEAVVLITQNVKNLLK